MEPIGKDASVEVDSKPEAKQFVTITENSATLPKDTKYAWKNNTSPDTSVVSEAKPYEITITYNDGTSETALLILLL